MKKLKILYITPFYPFPPNDGGKIVIYNRIKHLALLGHEIYLYSLIWAKDKQRLRENDVVEMKRYCKEVHISAYEYSKPLKIAKALLASVVKADTLKNLTIPEEFKHELQAAVQSQHFDFGIVEFTYFGVWVKKILQDRIKLVLSIHNIDSQFYREIARAEQNIVRKIYLYYESILAKRMELAPFFKKEYDLFMFLSDVESEYIIQKVPDVRDRFVSFPFGLFDKETYAGAPVKKNGKLILFTGALNMGTNIKGVKWFLKEVMPAVRSKVPDAVFYAVGSNPSPELIRLQDEYTDFKIFANVDKIEPYMSAADLFVIPLLGGVGLKIKLFDALSARKLIVTTKSGVIGTDFKDGDLLFVADTPENFAERCITLLLNKEKYEKSFISRIDKLYEKRAWPSITARVINEIMAKLGL